MPAQAAVRVRGEVFTGRNHGEAINSAVDKYGSSVWDDIDKSIASGTIDHSGFLTSDGRYVSRQEAQSLMNKRGLLDRDRMSDPDGLDSGDIFFSNSRASAPGVLAAEAADKPKGIRAYHGSPHDFDRFDLSKSGSGVGFNSYGHGVNLTMSEDVGKIYKHALADPDGGHLRINANPDGHIYEVNAHVSPDRLLDWQKKVADQPYIADRFPQEWHGMTGGEVHDMLENGLKDQARQAYKDGKMSMFKQPDYKKQIADKLKELGIQGVSYVDNNAKKSLGTGARNLTVFDDALIEILRKYMNPQTAAAPGVLMLEGAKDARQ